MATRTSSMFSGRIITILGPTASGKTRLAALLAHRTGAAVVSADSRQVYRGMDIGTGKDLADYVVGDTRVPCYLVDCCEAGEEYNLHRYLVDFHKIYRELQERGQPVILCGGTGMYIEAVLRGYNVVAVPENKDLLESLKEKSMEELKAMLFELGPVHATSDLADRDRLQTAITQRMYYRDHNIPRLTGGVPSLTFGLSYPRAGQREKITDRLHQRLAGGMIEEVSALIEKGVNVKQLLAYGLEYKWITLYLTGKYSIEEMEANLNTAIHRFAKRQMTWFRRMERNGIRIHWIDATLPMEDKLNFITKTLNNFDR